LPERARKAAAAAATLDDHEFGVLPLPNDRFRRRQEQRCVTLVGLWGHDQDDTRETLLVGQAGLQPNAERVAELGEDLPRPRRGCRLRRRSLRARPYNLLDRQRPHPTIDARRHGVIVGIAEGPARSGKLLERRGDLGHGSRGVIGGRSGGRQPQCLGGLADQLTHR